MIGSAMFTAARSYFLAALTAVALCLVPVSASAQVYIQDIPRGGNLEISGGVLWMPGSDLGTASAEETRNPGTGTGPFVLFQTDSRTDAAPGVQGKLGVYLSRSVSIEGGASLARCALAGAAMVRCTDVRERAELHPAGRPPAREPGAERWRQLGAGVRPRVVHRQRDTQSRERHGSIRAVSNKYTYRVGTGAAGTARGVSLPNDIG